MSLEEPCTAAVVWHTASQDDLRQSLSHHQPHHLGVYKPRSYPSSQVTLITTPEVEQSTMYHSHFTEGETEAQQGSATSSPKVTLQVRGLLRPWVCLIPNPGDSPAVRILAKEVADSESGLPHPGQ